MGKVFYFSLFFLGCLIFGSSSAQKEEVVDFDADDEQADAKSPCPAGVLYFRQNCYEFIPRYETWDSAEAACQNLRHGGHLASFSSMREEKMVSAHIKSRSSSNYVWIGLNATPNMNRLVWEWSDGSSYSSGSSLWDNRSPSTYISSSECLALYSVQSPSSSARWLQYNCEATWPFVCKYKPGK